MFPHGWRHRLCVYNAVIHVLATLLPLQLLCCKGFLLRLFLCITYCIGLQQKPLWQIISRPRWRPLILGSLKWPRSKETWWGQLNYEEVLRWVSRSFSTCCRLDCRGQKQSMGPRCSCWEEEPLGWIHKAVALRPSTAFGFYGYVHATGRTDFISSSSKDDAWKAESGRCSSQKEPHKAVED